MSRYLKCALGGVFGLAFLLAWLAGMQQTQAQARRLTWDGSVTYQNIGDAATPVQVLFYPEGETEPLRFDPLNGGTLPQRAGRWPPTLRGFRPETPVKSFTWPPLCAQSLKWKPGTPLPMSAARTRR